jgi:hypothetical protein
MYARAVDDAAQRLRTLRHEECGDLALAVAALAGAVAVTQVHPPLAAPLFLGGLAVGVLGLRALWRRWDLVERLAGERDAHVIPEVLAYARREATMERRRTFAALIRRELPRSGRPVHARVAAVADELAGLAQELEDDALELDPVAAVSCMRLLSDVTESPLFNTSLPTEELRSRIRRIRCGLRPASYGQETVPARTAARPAGLTEA